MADSSLVIKGATANETVSARTNATGEKMEVVVIGIDGSDSVVTADAVNGLDVDVTRVSGTVTTQAVVAGTATLANVSGSATSVTLIASNGSRKGAVIHNDSTAILYLKYGTTASTTSYTYKVPADGTFEMPAVVYTGTITGIWSSATGAARTTELT